MSGRQVRLHAARATHRADRHASLWEFFDLGTPEVTEWMRDGLCAQTDPESFFPRKGGDVRPAKAVCAACPVLSSCRDYALARPELSGIWGGTSARERTALRQVSDPAVDRRVA